ncbi:MAG: lipopolysaccharide heptosyltransferase II [Verrucomicrobiales bacterium]|nr:lipopolysaccharide heptosyltransferase II [Verrucomicrobiales bacterium]
MKILILKPSSLGDVVQALPVLRLLKRHRPNSAIYWWIDSPLAPLLEGDPDLAGVVRFERHRWASPRHWPEALQHVRWLRAQQFDWVIDLQSLLRTGAVAWLTNGGLLVGLDEPREGARGFYDIIVPRPSFHTHAVDWYRAVLPALGLPADGDFVWLPPRADVAASIRQRWQTDAARWIALQPGARWDNKRWPVGHFAELVRRLAAEFPHARVVILGGADDAALAARIAGAAPDRCLNLAGQTTLPELVEWLRLVSVLVTNDTGPMHIAAALGTPLVALFGPTEPRRTGPYRRLDAVLQHALPCVPCLKPRCRWPRPLECLTALTPEAVFERVRQLLLPG